MKRLIFVLALSLLWLGSGITSASPLGDAIRDADQGRVLIWNRCEYDIKMKDPKVDKLVKRSNGFGNGFFIEHQYDRKPNIHTVSTAKHVVTCPQSIEGFASDQFKLEDVDSFLTHSSFFVIIKGVAYFATLGDYEVNKGTVDLAVLEVALPANTIHYHNLLLPDEIDYDIGTEFIVRGFMPFPDEDFENDKDGWISRFQFTHLESISDNGLFMQLSNSAFSGQSGSAVYLYENGKLYLVGVLVMAASTNFGNTYDTSWATILKKEYIIQKKKP